MKALGLPGVSTHSLFVLIIEAENSKVSLSHITFLDLENQ